ncbi:MAG: hypothetical protein ACYTG5_19055 [Planctomycetota bacterium]
MSIEIGTDLQIIRKPTKVEDFGIREFVDSLDCLHLLHTPLSLPIEEVMVLELATQTCTPSSSNSIDPFDRLVIRFVNDPASRAQAPESTTPVRYELPYLGKRSFRQFDHFAPAIILK